MDSASISARSVRALIVGLLVVGLAVLAPAVVLAHAGVVRTTPADGERLAVSPPTFEIEFSEPIGVDADGVRVVEATGTPVDLAPARAEGTVVVQELPPLADGWYQASWSVVSSDGHVVHGAVAFAVGDVTGPPPDAAAIDSAAIPVAVARGVADLGLIVAVGAVAAVVVLRARSAGVRRLAIGAAFLGAVGSLGVVVLTLIDAGQAAVAGPAGLAAMVRIASLSGVAAAVAVRRWHVALGLAGLALATMVVGGHPGEGFLTAGLLVLHLAAAGVWLGAAPAVLIVLLDREMPDADALVTVRRFSRAATVALFMVIGAGSLLALLLTDARVDGLDPRYLTLLAAKVGLVAVAAGLGAITRRRLARDTARRHDLRRLFLVDAALLVAVIACSAGLTMGSPRDVAADDDIHVGHCSIETEDGIASLSLIPARVGDNEIFLDAVGDLQSAQVEFRRPGEAGAIEVGLAPAGIGWTGDGALPVVGTWDVTVVLQRDAFTVARPTCALRIEP
jgi:copper transport protein